MCSTKYTSSYLLACLMLLTTPELFAGAYIFSGEANGVDLVTHPTTYTGTGGNITVRICIDPTSQNATDLVIPIQNNINILNALVPTTANLKHGGSNNIPSGEIDLESVALHEVGHCLGLAHVNAASESGLPNSTINSTKATDGNNNTFDVNSGVDGVIGSSDDVRGDDVNLHWFRMSNNDPFTIDSVVDETTYSVDIADLPAGHNYAANGDRSVSSLLGYGSTETIMQQGTFFDEAQRTLGHDDVATLLYAASGKDEKAGTNDDYTFTLEYGGISATNCDVSVSMTNTAGLAFCGVSGSYIGNPNQKHLRVTNAAIEFGAGYSWFFNTETVNQPPVLDVIGNQSISESESLVLNLMANDNEGDAISYSASGLPAFVTLTDSGNGAAVLDVNSAFGDVGIYQITITVTDDGLPNVSSEEIVTLTVNVLDSDGDGLSDLDEISLYFTDENNPDSDADGLNDGDEVNTHLTDPNDSDSDNDGLSDGGEVNLYLTDPLNNDSDSDGLVDGDEVNLHDTNPNNADSDNDGLDDSAEINIYVTDPNSSDTDGDSLSDGAEVSVYSTDPNDSDSDGEGLNDGDEVNLHLTDPNNDDSDSDGLNDFDEVLIHSTNPNVQDTDGDGLNDGDEITLYSSNPLFIDTDGDGLTDYEEVITYFTNPTIADTDSDGLTDFDEINNYFTNPTAIDSDIDGIIDGDEVNVYSTDPNNSDSDADGLTDGTEVFTTLTDPNNADSDGDGLTDGDEVNVYLTDPNNLDSDGDGFDDFDEVTNGSDPNDSNSAPASADGDLAPLGAPDGLINAADLLIMNRIIIGDLVPTPLEYMHGDMYPAGAPDGVINTSDGLLLQQLIFP